MSNQDARTKQGGWFWTAMLAGLVLTAIFNRATINSHHNDYLLLKQRVEAALGEHEKVSKSVSANTDRLERMDRGGAELMSRVERLARRIEAAEK